MPRYFFNIRLDDAYLPERTGQCAPDAEAAWAIARTIISTLIAQYGGETRLLDAVLDVRDEHGQPVFELSFFEAIYVPVQPPAAKPARLPNRTALPRFPRIGGLLDRVGTAGRHHAGRVVERADTMRRRLQVAYEESLPRLRAWTERLRLAHGL